jgi:succinate dehydrogenase/fumarate reductase flavoprotein subunit
MKIAPNTTAPPIALKSPETAPVHTPLGSQSEGWNQLINRFTKITEGNSGVAPTAAGMQKNLTELLKLQMDVGRYQLRVEMLSKVADSAMVTIRKMQQAQ